MVVRLWSWFRAIWARNPALEVTEALTEAVTEAPQDGAFQVPIEASIDLHFFAPRDVPSVTFEYLLAAQKKGFDEVRLIHGRGKGVQRQKVQKVAARHPAVLAIRSDGLGSTLVRLRKSPKI